MNKIYLVDVSSLLFRAFYAIRPLTSPKGLPVNAIYGFLTMILKLMREEKPEYIVFCFDRPEASFRKKISESYKANRGEMPEDLAPQMPYFRRIGGVLGIPCIDMEGFEADDVIGTLTKFGREQNLDVVIVSGDKDFAQLVDGHVCMLDTMKGIRYHSPQVKEKWGVYPHQIVDYLAMVGDSSDNIAGVRGIGPKGAVKLLEEFGSLEGIYENLDKIKGATKEKLIASREEAFLAKKLVTIHCDMPLPRDLSAYRLGSAHEKEVEALLDELNFKTLRPTLKQLPNWQGAGAPLAEPSPAAVPASAAPAMESIEVEMVEKGEEVFFTEKEIWLVSTGQGIFLAGEKSRKALPWRVLSEKAKERLLALPLVGFDLKKVFHEVSAPGRPRAQWDSRLASYMLKPGELTSWGQVAARYLGHTPADELSIERHLAEQMMVRRALERELETTSVSRVYRELELPLVTVLYDMERTGVRLDCDILREQGEELAKDIRRLETEIQRQAGREFNVGSPKQLAHILFDVLKLPTGRKTKTGFSTDNEVLSKLRKVHPIADLILQYREVAKLKSTYLDALPALVGKDGRLHTTFNQALTMTGRLSSQDPNLQNIPVRSEMGAAIRKAFIAADGCELLSADYSQIELRILAHYSEDKNLIRAFEEDLDIHALTAAEVFGVPLKEVTGDQRRAAKAVNFGIAYGQGAFGLAENLGIPRSEAQQIIQRYFQRFPGVNEYIQRTIEEAKDKGFVETLLGRKRIMDELRSANPTIRKFGERAAINAPIQGTAADIVKKAMIDLHSLSSKMILQVHDELLFEGPPAVLKKEATRIVSVMENTVKLKVPLKVNVGTGRNWQEAH